MENDNASREANKETKELPLEHVAPVEPAKDTPETIGESQPTVDEPFEGYNCSDY